MFVTEEQNPRLPFLREKTARLTTESGCYIMKDKSGKIIYIGKAKNLKNRVTSYFRPSQDHLPKVAKMVSQVEDYDFIVTASEFEALILECSLIKQNKPKYNILLKDSKGYSYIKISNGEYPRITYELQKIGEGTFIGPYTSGFTAKQTVIEANKVFALPTCTRRFPQEIGKGRPCLNHHIKQCMGVCTGRISKEEYNQIVEQAVEFIQNGSAVSIERLTTAMNDAAEKLDFETAARYRDRIVAIKRSADKQMVVEKDIRDTDVVALSFNNEQACASVVMYRGGKLFDKADFLLGEIDDEASAMREEFILRFYSDKDDIPREVLLDDEPAHTDILEQFLSEKAGRKVTVSVPQRGNPLKLAMLAKNNASEYLAMKVGRTGREIVALEELAKALGLEKPPQYIECYDISNLASTAMVAGMVVFENGRPLKKAYKKFSIKTVAEQNDYACMREVLSRRFNRYFEGEDEGFSRMPDVVFLDGGKGHVGAVAPVIRELGINVPVFGIVKDSNHRTRAIASEGGEISISKNKSAFMLLTRIQDEVHRYAISYQKQMHSKNTYELELTKIRGIGEKKATKLLSHYKTKELLKKAEPEEISALLGVTLETALEICNVIDRM